MSPPSTHFFQLFPFAPLFPQLSYTIIPNCLIILHHYPQLLNYPTQLSLIAYFTTFCHYFVLQLPQLLIYPIYYPQLFPTAITSSLVALLSSIYPNLPNIFPDLPDICPNLPNTCPNLPNTWLNSSNDNWNSFHWMTIHPMLVQFPSKLTSHYPN